MNFRFDVYVHFDAPASRDIDELTRELRARNDQLEAEVRQLGSGQAAFTSASTVGGFDMGTGNTQQIVENLRIEIERNRSVDESAITLINHLASQVEQLKTDPAALQALVDQIRASSDTLASAVTANTPADTGEGGGGTDEVTG